jgi:hypothetical protein
MIANQISDIHMPSRPSLRYLPSLPVQLQQLHRPSESQKGFCEKRHFSIMMSHEVGGMRAFAFSTVFQTVQNINVFPAHSHFDCLSVGGSPQHLKILISLSQFLLAFDMIWK